MNKLLLILIIVFFTISCTKITISSNKSKIIDIEKPKHISKIFINFNTQKLDKYTRKLNKQDFSLQILNKLRKKLKIQNIKIEYHQVKGLEIEKNRAKYHSPEIYCSIIEQDPKFPNENFDSQFISYNLKFDIYKYNKDKKIILMNSIIKLEQGKNLNINNICNKIVEFLNNNIL